MAKIAVITDTNSGITNREAKELGVSIVPMPFLINGDTYYEGVNMTQEHFYKMLRKGAEISTSQPSPESVTGLWEKTLETCDQVVYIPMSSGLSGSTLTAMMLAQDYKGRVFVVDNQRISVTQAQSVFDAVELSKKGFDGREIQEILERDRFESSIYITVDTLKYLARGGRMTPAVAALGRVLRIKPVLQIQGEKLDKFAKARTMKQAKKIMIDAIKSDMENRFKLDFSGKDAFIGMAHTDSPDALAEFKAEVEEAFPGYPVYSAPLSLSISCHIGPGSLAVTCTKRLPELV